MAIFQKVKAARVPKTAFNLSHERKFSMELGKLTPVLCEEVVPGDKFNIRTETLVRLAPMIAPIMHRVDAYIHYFYVPNRIIWSDFEKFLTGDLVTTVPTRLFNWTPQPGDLSDYLGVPTQYANQDVSQLPFRAFWSIWNEYYRDQNLQTEVDIASLAGSNYQNLPYRSWTKDYFTSALPWAQKGSPVTIEGSTITYKDESEWYRRDGSAFAANTPTMAASVPTTEGRLVDNSNATPQNTRVENIDSFGFELNELRTANTLQKYLEALARGGSRYREFLLSMFGVRSSDQRVDVPEFIGGGKTPITISEVLNTSDTANAPQGDMAGHGLAAGTSTKAGKYMKEHGWVIGVMSILPKPAYFQGLHRKFTRSTNLDFYNPHFANLGEQEILNKELFWANAGDQDDTWGYQSRYAEFKYHADEIAGDMRSNLEFWHMGRKFASQPALNETFITTEAEAPGLEQRVFAAGRTSHPFWVQLYHNIKAVRPMPYFGTPKL